MQDRLRRFCAPQLRKGKAPAGHKSEDPAGTITLIPHVSLYDYPPTPFLIDQIINITKTNNAANNATSRSCGNGISNYNDDSSSNVTSTTNATKTDANNLADIVGIVDDDNMTVASDKADDEEEEMLKRCYVAIASSDLNRDNFLTRGNEYIRMLYLLATTTDTNATNSLNSLSIGFWENNTTVFDIYDRYAIVMNYYGHSNSNKYNNSATDAISKQVYVYGTKPGHQDDYSAIDMKHYIDSFCRDVICELHRVNLLF